MNAQIDQKTRPISYWLDQMREQWQRAPAPEQEIAHDITEEGRRAAEFKRVCPEEFITPVDRQRLISQISFDRIASWNGEHPGPIAVGPTGTSKTRAAWSALGRLYVRQHKAFVWFPVRRLITQMSKYEQADLADECFHNWTFYEILFVDDLEKINWQFQSESEYLFSFYDWVYRCRRPCMTTTNMSRQWWADKMGDAFVRRVFDEAHHEVKF